MDAALELGGPKQRTVLASLLLDPGRPLSVGGLIERIWGESPPERAEASLQVYVSNLRRVIEPERGPRSAPQVLVTRPTGYVLALERDEVDISAFEDLAAAGHQLLQAGQAVAAIERLEEALALWAGDPLPELASEWWVAEVSVRLRSIRARARGDRFEASLRLGRHESVIADLEAAIAEEPFREHLRAQLALALYRSGRQRDALSVLADARRELADEAGLDPSGELRRLESDILAQSPSLDLPTGTIPEAGSTATAGDARSSSNAPTDAAGALRRRKGAFLGRSGELGALIDATRAAAEGRGGVVVVSGEPGIGKTRLVEELVDACPGTAVLWGRCPETAGTAAYLPLLEIAHQLDELGVLKESLVAAFPGADAERTTEPTADRVRLHLAIAALLRTATQPVVLVVDDLQWADAGSLHVLEFVAAGLPRSNLLLITTIRPVTSTAPPALVDCLGEFGRLPGAMRLELDGLSSSEVAAWLEARSNAAHPTAAEMVHERTDGNPFFVNELIEMLLTEDGLGEHALARAATGIPAAVHDVIRRRVRRLPSATQQLLSTASVIGRTFPVDVLAAVSAEGSLAVLDGLDAAIEAKLVVETGRPGQLRFAHALIADAMLAELTPSQRARIHALVSTRLAELRAADLTPHLAELAHHAIEGAIAGTADAAVEWSTRHARSSMGRLAFEDAAAAWQHVVDALAISRPADGRARCEALIEAALAHFAADTVLAGYHSLVAAIDAALHLGDVELLERAATAANLDGLWSGEIALGGGVDIVGALERALAALPAENAKARALALSALADNAYFSKPIDELDRISAAAVEIARGSGDPQVLARSLHKRQQAMFWSSTFSQRADAAEELTALLASQAVSPALAAVAHFGMASVDWTRGRVSEARDQGRRSLAFAETCGSSALITQLGVFESALAIWSGQLDKAERLILASTDRYRRTRPWVADSFVGGYLAMISFERGRPEDMKRWGGNDLHVWLYKHNPAGTLAVWNPNVRCSTPNAGHGDTKP